MFDAQARKKQKRGLPKKYFAVRQIAGPTAHRDVIIFCSDQLEAKRQFFCWHGLTGKTYRYQLRAVEIPSDHPEAEKAVECPHPRGVGERTLDAIQQEQFEDVEQMVKSGEAANTIA
jgi:hypothetical protein